MSENIEIIDEALKTLELVDWEELPPEFQNMFIKAHGLLMTISESDSE